MTVETVKSSLIPALIGAIISGFGSSFYHQLSTVERLAELTTTIQVYIPATERRIMEIDQQADLNSKRIQLNEIALARMAYDRERDK